MPNTLLFKIMYWQANATQVFHLLAVSLGSAAHIPDIDQKACIALDSITFIQLTNPRTRIHSSQPKNVTPRTRVLIALIPACDITSVRVPPSHQNFNIMRASQRLSKKKNLLLSFDAFGTLFTPKAPIATQYGEIAKLHGLAGFTNDELNASFKRGELLFFR